MFLRSNVLEMEWRLESYYYCTGDACTVYRCLQSISCHMVADFFHDRRMLPLSLA